MTTGTIANTTAPIAALSSKPASTDESAAPMADTFTASSPDSTGIYSPKLVTLNGPVTVSGQFQPRLVTLDGGPLSVPGKFQPRICTQNGPVTVPGKFQPKIVTQDGPVTVPGKFQPR